MAGSGTSAIGEKAAGAAESVPTAPAKTPKQTLWERLRRRDMWPRSWLDPIPKKTPVIPSIVAKLQPKIARLWERLQRRDRWPRSWWYPERPEPAKKQKPSEAVQQDYEQCVATVRRTMLVLLGFCLFAIVVTFGTPDSALIASEAKITLPFAESKIEFLGFLIAAPALLIILILYLHIFDTSRRTFESQYDLDKVTTLFTHDSPLPRFLTYLIFYWLVPVVLAAITVKALARLEWGLPLLGVTIVITAVLIWIQIRRCSSERRRLKTLPLWGALVGLVAVAGFASWESVTGIIGPREWYQDALRRPLNLFRADLSNKWLANADLRNADLRFASLSGTNLSSASLRHADLTGAQLKDADVTRADFYGANLFDADLRDTQNLWLTNLRVARNLNRANLRGADLSGAELQGTSLVSATLQGAHLRNANLNGAILKLANLQEADLSGAELVGAKFQKDLPQGPHLPTAELNDARLLRAKLSGANLSRAKLQKADLRGMDLRNVVLSNANLQGANLFRTDLRGAILSGASLHGANLFRADLRGANLSGAKLHGADVDEAFLQGANLRRAELLGTNLRQAQLQGADLREAKALAASWQTSDLRGGDVSGTDVWQAPYPAILQRYGPMPFGSVLGSPLVDKEKEDLISELHRAIADQGLRDKVKESLESLLQPHPPPWDDADQWRAFINAAKVRRIEKLATYLGDLACEDDTGYVATGLARRAESYVLIDNEGDLGRRLARELATKPCEGTRALAGETRARLRELAGPEDAETHITAEPFTPRPDPPPRRSRSVR